MKFGGLCWQDGNAAFVNLNVGPRYPDTVQDLFLIGTNQGMANTTRFRLRRRYETGDRNDVDILKASPTFSFQHPSGRQPVGDPMPESSSFPFRLVEKP